MDFQFSEAEVFNWVILPLIIFFSRMTDVTLGTLRHIFLAKHVKKVVPFLGFIEVLIWLIVISQIMKNLNNWVCYIAWASGFAMGTVVGMYIEEKLALGLQVIRIITNQESTKLLEALNEANIGITMLDGHGSKGPVKILFTVIKRKDLEKIVSIIRENIPNAFYSVEDIREVKAGVFPGTMGGTKRFYNLSRMFPVRKAK